MFRSTVPGSSPGADARFRDANGPPLSPPWRSVNATSTECAASAWVSWKANTRRWLLGLLQEVGHVQVVVVELELARLPGWLPALPIVARGRAGVDPGPRGHPDRLLLPRRRGRRAGGRAGGGPVDGRGAGRRRLVGLDRLGLRRGSRRGLLG